MTPTAPMFTSSGIQVQTMQEIIDELATGYKTIYGSDIDLSPNTPDGQRIGIEAQARLDLQSFGALLYNQLDPDFSFGSSLDRIIKFSGITRSPGTQSTVDVTIVTNQNLTLPIGYIVADTLLQNWITLTSWSLTTGLNTVTLFSENFASITAAIGTVINPITIVLGVVSVTNAAIAIVGSDEETDEQLRIRRNLSLLVPATSSIGGLYSALGDIASVTDLAVYENNTDTTDIDGVPPHSIWCIIQGGSVADIAQTLAVTKNAGTGMKGSVSQTYVETITLPVTPEFPNGRTFYYSHVMLFDRPAAKTIDITVTVTSTNLLPPNTALIAKNLAALKFTIGENVYASDLYATIYSSGTGFYASELKICIHGGIPDYAPVLAGPDGIITIPIADITITEVIP